MQKKRFVFLAGIFVALLSLAFLVAACGGDDDDGNGGVTDGGGTVDVSHGEFFVDTSVDAIGAGTVTFEVSNDGTIMHNFLVIKTDTAPDALPVIEEQFVVDEEQLDVVATSADLNTGETETLTLDLEPGSYVLICNIASHYQAGTFTGFTVE